MSPGALFRPLRYRAGCVGVARAIAFIVATLAAFPPPVVFASDVPQGPQLGGYPYTQVGRKSVNPDAMRPPVGAPSQNLVGPEKSAGRASPIPDPQNAIERMLRARELSFAPSRRLDQDPRAANYGMDLSAVKLRVSRNSVMLRAHFSFN